MGKKVFGTRSLLSVVAFVGLLGGAPDAKALSNNVPYTVNGKALTVLNGTDGSAAFFNGMFYFAYVAPDGNLGIFADSNTGNGQNVVYSYEVNIASGGWAGLRGTALAANNGTLYLFYLRGTGVNQSYLAMITTTDGTHWSGEQFISWGTQNKFATAPTAVVWEGQVLVYVNEGYNGSGTIDQFNIVGTSTSGPYRTYAGGATYVTNVRPTATVWQGELVVAFCDMSNGNNIGIITYTDARGWSDETLTGLHGIPSVYPLGAGPLNMVYVSDSNDHLYGTWTSDGVSFGTPQEDTRSTTFRGPVQFATWSVSYSDWTFYVGEDNELFTVLE